MVLYEGCCGPEIFRSSEVHDTVLGFTVHLIGIVELVTDNISIAINGRWY